MLGTNYEKMGLISPAAAKDWPQTQLLSDDIKVSMSNNNMDNNNSSRNSSAMVMSNQKLAHHQQDQQQQQQQQQQALKCPRCDSSNTKFCYYNNYSLTQPRHFCKACKRYWTRGGTLRNVPVGGGCRKNKRVKRPNINSSSNNNSSSSAASIDAALPASATPTSHHPLLGHHHHNLNPSSESYLNNNHHLFYSNNNPNDLLYQNRYGGGGGNPSSRVVVSGLENTVSGYDLIPGLGLGFSSGNSIIDVNANPSKEMEMHSVVNSSSNNSFLSSCYSSLIGTGGSGGIFSSPSGSATMSSLIASYGLQKFNCNGGSGKLSQDGGTRIGGGNSSGNSSQFQTFFPFEEMQMSSSSHGFGTNEQNKDVKSGVVVPCQNNQMEQTNDPASYWNNNNNAAAAAVVHGGGGAWPDLANIGSSVTSLI